MAGRALAGARGVVVAGAFTGLIAPSGATPGRSPGVPAARPGSPAVCGRVAGTPPAKGLGSPPAVGGLREAGATGLAGAALGPDGFPAGAAASASGPAKSAGLGSLSAAARARIAADAAGLECDPDDGAGEATFPEWAGFGVCSEGGGLAGAGRTPGEGVRAGAEPGGLEPARPPPIGGFGGCPGDMRQTFRIHDDPTPRCTVMRATS